jgi:hypothetical protein
MIHARRALFEVLALGLANGLLLGAALAAANPGPALLLACGAGTVVTLVYLLTTRWKPFRIQEFTEPLRRPPSNVN